MSDKRFCRCSDFQSVCCSSSLSFPPMQSDFYAVFKHTAHSFATFFCFLFPPYVLFNSFLPLLPPPPLLQCSVSFSQNNNNKLSDAARWPAHTPEETESHSSTPTDNPPRKASFPFWNNALIYTRVTLNVVQEKAEERERWRTQRPTVENYFFKKHHWILEDCENDKKTFHTTAIFLPN